MNDQPQEGGIVLLVTQQDILPGAVKNRHMSEPNSFIVTGLDAKLPKTGVTSGGVVGVSIFFAYDTSKLYIWNKSTKTWKSVSLT